MSKFLSLLITLNHTTEFIYWKKVSYEDLKRGVKEVLAFVLGVISVFFPPY
jgi:hypothetical protein